MKVLVIFLCIAIGHVDGELEGRDSEAVENLRVNREATRVVKPRGIYYESGNYFVEVPVRANGADPARKKTSRGSSPVFQTTPTLQTTRTVRSIPSEAVENNLELMYLRKLETQFKVLDYIADSINARSEEKGKMTFGDLLKGVYWDTDARIRSEMILANVAGNLLRLKRQAEAEADAEVVDPSDAILSYRLYNDIRKKLPLAMRLKIRETVLDEDMLLDSYAKTGTATKDLLEAYDAAKLVELTELKRQTRESGIGVQELIANYKLLRKGKVWNFVTLRQKYKAFFDHPSPALTEYEALKLKELTAVDGFLSGSDQAESEGGALEPAGQETSSSIVTDTLPAGLTGTKGARSSRDGVPVAAATVAAPAAGLSREVPGGAQAAQGGDDPKDILASFDKYLKLSANFSADLKLQMFHTDAAEKRVLLSYVESNSARKEILDNYYAERKKEIELLKLELTRVKPEAAPSVLSAYKTRRKGTVWNYLKNTDDDRRSFFNQVSSGRSEYEALKKKELDIDRYLTGALAIEDRAPDASEKPQPAEDSERAKSKEIYRVERAMVAEIVRVKEDEEIERRAARDAQTETVGVDVGYVAGTDSFETVAPTTVTVNERVYIEVEFDEVPDDVTSAASASAEIIVDTVQAENRSRLVRIAVLFALVMQVLIAILILGPEMSKLTEWWKKGKTDNTNLEAGMKERPELLRFREPLYAGARSLLLVRPGKCQRIVSVEDG